jgi:hypothetical protein
LVTIETVCLLLSMSSVPADFTAWVLGAGDPSSGTASMYEMIRGLGALLRKGWKPMRTIILASWDAEEYGLIGSVEWTEDFGDWLSAHSESSMCSPSVLGWCPC